jgi:hypothetical protein
MTNTHRTQISMALPRRTTCLRSFGLLAILGLLANCAPTGPSDESLQSSIVVTLRAPQTDFGSYRTYHLRPVIRELTGDGTGTATIDSTIAGAMLDETRKQMAARGYESLDSPTGADLALEMIYVSSQWLSTYCYSWWDPYYWGYPGYSYYPYYDCGASTWQTSTLATMITDLSSAGEPADRGTTPRTKPQQVLGGIWFSGIAGLVLSASDTVQKGIDGIDQAFVQSPYLVRH